MSARKGKRLSQVLQVHLSGIIASADDVFMTVKRPQSQRYRRSVFSQEPLWHADYVWVKLRADGDPPRP
jgi:hypothetical protein